jgi:succinate-semialdehyde dehydrogenase/glutarate-semialdehyde dehydrogenase
VRRHQLYIGGEWLDSDGDVFEPVRSPATGEVIAEVSMATPSDADRAVEAARRGQRELATMTVYERAELVERVAQLILERKEVIAHDLAREQGKPFRSDAIVEVEVAAEMWLDAGRIIRHLEGSVLPSTDPGRRILTVRQPRGVYAIMSPWNFPATIPTEYLCAGLVAGDAIVWKPATTTPLTAFHLAACIADAGAPAGAVNVVTGAVPRSGKRWRHIRESMPSA